ncbi:hypothetical protein [Kitasatospora sp. NPDC127116]|uniref:hypothetical protein n=1 Tax=Kitasatospora sp. NPDC127116 TaxID=3345367 RepID=UPI0036284DE9
MMTHHDIRKLPDGGQVVAEEHTLTTDQMQQALATGGTVTPGLLVDPDHGPDGCVLPPRAGRLIDVTTMSDSGKRFLLVPLVQAQPTQQVDTDSQHLTHNGHSL